MLRILVVIPTTDGPILVRSLRPRAGLPASAAFVDGDYRPLPWSSDYARLSSADGPLAGIIPAERLLPHELRLTRSFDAGRSWEVPACLAHALLAAGHRLVGDPAEAEAIVWATGAVDLDLCLLPGTFAVLDKLERSRGLLEGASGKPLVALLPPGVEKSEFELILKGFARKADAFVHSADSIRDAARFLGSRLGEAEPAPGLAVRPGAIAFRTAGLVALSLGAVGAGLFLAIPGRMPPNGPPAQGEFPRPAGNESAQGLKSEEQASPESKRKGDHAEGAVPTGAEGVGPGTMPAEPTLLVEELRAKTGSSCRRVAFGADTPERRPIVRDAPDRLRPSRNEPGLCGLAFSPGRPGARISVGPELRAAALPPVGLPDGAQAYFLRENAPQTIVYRIQVVLGEQGSRLEHAINR